MDFTELVLSQLPPPPARVLELGCGAGELTRMLDRAGYDVVGIDPAAPDGPLFRRLKLADLEARERFDAVVAARTLHHVTDLAAGLDKIASLLPQGGLLVLDELGWDRLDRATAEWFWGQRRVLAAARGDAAPSDVDRCVADWEAEHVGLHGYEAMRRELARRFEERYFAWEPYLHRYLEGVASESLERSLIDADAIQALGWRYVGESPRPTGAAPPCGRG